MQRMLFSILGVMLLNACASAAPDGDIEAQSGISQGLVTSSLDLDSSPSLAVHAHSICTDWFGPQVHGKCPRAPGWKTYPVLDFCEYVWRRSSPPDSRPEVVNARQLEPALASCTSTSSYALVVEASSVPVRDQFPEAVSLDPAPGQAAPPAPQTELADPGSDAEDGPETQYAISNVSNGKDGGRPIYYAAVRKLWAKQQFLFKLNGIQYQVPSQGLFDLVGAPTTVTSVEPAWTVVAQ
ncbi:MAG TPA: hypothetical protein VFQ61_03735 [Polyangiaceae bacterium]|nr:hypothetical protein [Polyangiaceae bacterium]